MALRTKKVDVTSFMVPEGGKTCQTCRHFDEKEMVCFSDAVGLLSAKLNVWPSVGALVSEPDWCGPDRKWHEQENRNL